jgi:DUF4097 and DUF4098 domain-containing protein YvlB
MKPHNAERNYLPAALALAALALTALGGGAAAAAVGETADRVTVPLSDPGRPATVKVSLVAGGIRVEGYDGKEVMVEASFRGGPPPAEERARRDGLRRIANTSTGLDVEEKNNVVEIGTESWRNPTDLVIKVPRPTALKVSTVNEGDIVVAGIDGEIEVTNVNGAITLTGVAGPVVANTVNGGITATLRQVVADKAMSFTTLNGDVDVTLPSTIKADVRMNSENGDIFSDFDIAARPVSQPPEEGGKRKGFKVRIGREMRGQINGGGPEIYFKTFNGDILLRKGK